MRWKKSKWFSVLGVNILLFQFAVMPIAEASNLALTSEPDSNLQSTDRNTAEKPVFYVFGANEDSEGESPEDSLPSEIDDSGDSGSNAGSPEDKHDEEAEEKKEWKKPIVPTNFDSHLSKIEEFFIEFQSKKDVSTAKTLAYYIAYLPVGEHTGAALSEEKLEIMKVFLDDIKESYQPSEYEELGTFFANTLYEFAKTQKDPIHMHHLYLALKELPETKDVLKLLAEVNKYFKGLPDAPSPGAIPGSEDYTGGYGDYKPIDDGKVVGGLPRPGGTGGGSAGKIPEPDHSHKRSSYSLKGSACIQTTTYYQGNKVIRTDTKTVTGALRTLCFQNASAEQISPNPNRNGSFTGYDPYDKKQRTDKYQEGLEEKEKEILEGITIQYTFNRYDESPYYFDTGIAIGSKKLVSYEQAKAALQIISIQAKGRFVEDEDKVLALVDGQIIRIHSYEETVDFEEFAKNFELTSVNVRALDTRSGTQQEVVDLVEIKEISSIYFEDKLMELDARLIVDNNIVLYPAKQMIELLGGTSVENERFLTAVFGNKEIIYELDRSIAMKNEESIDLYVPTRENSQGVFMIPIGSLLELSKTSLSVENESIHLNKNKE